MPSPLRRRTITIPLIILLSFCSCAIPFYASKHNAMQKAQEFCINNEGKSIGDIILQASNAADRYRLVSNGIGLGHKISEQATSIVISYTVPATCSADCQFQIKEMKVHDGKSMYSCN